MTFLRPVLLFTLLTSAVSAETLPTVRVPSGTPAPKLLAATPKPAPALPVLVPKTPVATPSRPMLPGTLAQPPRQRTYTLDKGPGSISFGDGTRGRRPPTGTGNVVGSYRTPVPAGPVPIPYPTTAGPSLTATGLRLTPLDEAASHSQTPPTGSANDAQMRQLRLQQAAQQHSQAVSTLSNVMKSQHEAQKTIVNNLR